MPSDCYRVYVYRAIFLLEREKQINRQEDATERPTHAGVYTAGVQGNKEVRKEEYGKEGK